MYIDSLQLHYLGCAAGVSRASLEWVVDFSSCGLVIHHLALRARCSFSNQSSVSLCVSGDDSVSLYPQFGGELSMLLYSGMLTGGSRYDDRRSFRFVTSAFLYRHVTTNL